MSVKVDFGSFYDELYLAQTGPPGAALVLEFQPDVAKCKAVIGADGSVLEFNLIQIVREVIGPGGHARQGNAGYLARQAANGWALDMDWQAAYDDGYRETANTRKVALQQNLANPMFAWQLAIDHEKEKVHRKSGTVLTSLDPRYAQQRIALDIPLFTTKKELTNGNALILTAPYNWPGGLRRASLRDNPNVPIDCNIVGMEFQVAALMDYDLPGARQTRYLGSVRWGWNRSPGGSDVTLVPLALVHNSSVSAEFTAAATHWNGLGVDDPALLNGARHHVLTIPTQ